MSQLYVTGAIAAPERNEPTARVSLRAALLAIAALSLLLWSPILLPLTALLHR